MGSTSARPRAGEHDRKRGIRNVRMSKPAGPGVMRASIVLVSHTGQRGRGRVVMMLALDQAGALQNSQSPVAAVNGAVMEPPWTTIHFGTVPFCSVHQHKQLTKRRPRFISHGAGVPRDRRRAGGPLETCGGGAMVTKRGAPHGESPVSRASLVEAYIAALPFAPGRYRRGSRRRLPRRGGRRDRAGERTIARYFFKPLHVELLLNSSSRPLVGNTTFLGCTVVSPRLPPGTGFLSSETGAPKPA
jgi:hypothetical protein